MRKAPFRPDNEISQTFNSGVCSVWKQVDQAKPGYKPQPQLEYKGVLHYEEQRLGLNRYYTARQTNVEVERVIRVPKPPPSLIPTPQDVVRTDNGLFYRVDLVQAVPGVWPKCLDLTLVKFEQVASAAAGDAPQGSPAVRTKEK